jgi:hypothetical protein
MKHRTTQLGARKNPDSPRVHGLRRTANLSWLRSESQTGNVSEGKASLQAERFGPPSAGGYGL